MTTRITVKYVFLTVPGSGYSPIKSGLEIAWLIILCIIIIAASYFVTRFIGGTQIKKRRNSNFQLLDACPLGSHKYLQIIKAGRRFFVISVCKDAVSLIAELEEDELEHKDIPMHAANFNAVFTKYLNRKKDSGINTDGNNIKDNGKG